VVERCDVLAIGAHPDDAELGCGATLARLAATGRRVGIVDLTAGELATRGDPAIRAAEAAAAARTLGVAWRACLPLPDGGLAPRDREQLRAVVQALREAAPRALLLHHPDDPHPDHRAAAELAGQAAFLAGIGRWAPEAGAPCRPRLLLAFPGPRQLLEPGLVVDTTRHQDAKRAALACYRSQLGPDWSPAGAAAAPATHLASHYYLAAIEGRDRAAGNVVGCEFGEGLCAVGVMSADEVAWLLSDRQ